ncbi:hypothetical protein GCM10010402_01730 [Actinomadura luteofluorescens]|uniref:hypothetical protein n=1 Tax=Actinomadura luteofluorescens TaxID=46163 RepID=UPI00216481DC|nr:hypothetical protein [Actinomadura glauciflava]MCR3744113.1 hypothetical protein [Actinomadura glauciflava]
MAEVIHLIVRSVEDGLYATSPQAPGLAHGVSSLSELRAEIDEVLAFHFDRPGPFQVVEHHERHYEIAGGELVIRIALDEHRKEREEVHKRLGRALTVQDQARSLVATSVNRVGEAVYVCAVPSDTIGWLAEQFDPRGDALTVAVAVAEPFIVTVPFRYGEEDPVLGTVGITQEGYTLRSTLGEVLRETPIVRPVNGPHSIVA